MKLSIRIACLFCIVTLWLIPAFFAGCVTNLSNTGSEVWTTQEQQEVSNCKSLGQIEATSNKLKDMAYYDVIDKLKNQTGSMGGNWLLIKDYKPESLSGAKMIGEAYLCRDKNLK